MNILRCENLTKRKPWKEAFDFGPDLRGVATQVTTSVTEENGRKTTWTVSKLPGLQRPRVRGAETAPSRRLFRGDTLVTKQNKTTLGFY